MTEKFLSWLFSLNWTVLVAGFWGGSVYSLYKRASLSPWGVVSIIVTGVVIAHYGAEWLAAHASSVLSAFLGTSVTVGVGPAGFLCGVGGQVIVSGLISYMEKKKDEYVSKTNQ